MSDAPPPRVRVRADSFTRREKRLVAFGAVGPVVLALVVLAPIGWLNDASVVDVIIAALVYGGLVGLAGGVVVADRLQARQCPACATRNARDASMCSACAYDLEARPQFTCEEKHAMHVEPGLCECGRRLRQAPQPRGIGREIRAILKAGAWLLVFLVLVGLVLEHVVR